MMKSAYQRFLIALCLWWVVVVMLTESIWAGFGLLVVLAIFVLYHPDGQKKDGE